MTNFNHYLREIQCYVCGSWVRTTAARTMCPECAELRAQERARERYKYRSIDKYAYLVEYDPDTIGGYPKGALINRECMVFMLLPSYAAFTVGTILRNMKGDRFVVNRKKDGGLRLIALSLCETSVK